MANRDVLAIGASAGGVEALTFLAKHFRQDFPACILVTIHLSNLFPSSLDQVLSRAGPLPAVFPQDGEEVRNGRIYIAPPGRHLLLDGHRLQLGRGPRENSVRPSIDPMLRSAGLCCGSRSVGVVLTGTLGDGAAGLWGLKRCGGLTVVQDPNDAAFPEMPLNALDKSEPDHVVRLADMPALLWSLALQAASTPVEVPPSLRYEVEVARKGSAGMDEMDRFGRRSVLSCPDCQGVMWEIDEGALVRYRCHVGHAYTAELMTLALDENLRRALASALRALEERVAITRRLEKQEAERGRRHLTAVWASKAHEFECEMNVIRELIGRMDAIAARVDRDRKLPLQAAQ